MRFFIILIFAALFPWAAPSFAYDHPCNVSKIKVVYKDGHEQTVYARTNDFWLIESSNHTYPAFPCLQRIMLVKHPDLHEKHLKSFWVSMRNSVSLIDPKYVKSIKVIQGPKITPAGFVQILDVESAKKVTKRPLAIFHGKWSNRGHLYLLSYNSAIREKELETLFKKRKFSDITKDPWEDDVVWPKIRRQLSAQGVILLCFDYSDSYDCSDM